MMAFNTTTIIVLIIYAQLLCCISTFMIIGNNSMHLTQRNNHANISELLDNLLRGYDNSIRPGFGGIPAVIEVDIMVRSMGPISEVDMTYSMDCYFRQSWVDRRLAFVGAQNTLALSISMLAKIWKPDTYFYNGKQSYLHTITTPNKFVRLFQNGRVLYSSRLTIKAGCPMNLADFPMDVQRCPLKFGSFGYTNSDVIYKWKNPQKAVEIADDMKLSQFDLVDCPAGNMTDKIGHNKDDQDMLIPVPYVSEYSMLLVNFHLQRHMGNFLIQVYGPCVLLVVLSWVSFWLNREATADRVSLGITTVLTMTFLGLEARTDLPKVPYPTALDFFVFLSFAFIFATIIQFAIVHYFTKYGSGECYFSRDDFESESDSEVEEQCRSTLSRISEKRKRALNGNNRRNEARIFEVIPLSSCSVTFAHPTRRPKSSTWLEWPCRRKPRSTLTPDYKSAEDGYDTENAGNERSTSAATATIAAVAATTVRIPTTKKRLSFATSTKGTSSADEQRSSQRRTKRMPRFNSVSKIDRASRILFPFVFFLINLFYWYSYLTKSERWVPPMKRH